MAKEKRGVIYILKNPSFPKFVKIGYTDDLDARLAQLNRTECTPFAFRAYATYEVESRLSDKRVHSIIDKLNPDLRAIDYVDGVQRKREFYEMTAEDAFSILEAIAEINGREDCLHLLELSEKELKEQEEADEAEERWRERLAPFSFDKCNIAIGEEVVFSCRGNEYNGATCKVVSNKEVEFEGRTWSLSALAAALTNSSKAAGPRYFKYKGRWLNDIRAELEGWENKGRGATARIADSWVIPSNPKIYDAISAFGELDAVEWKQSTYIQTGDTVYIYVASPVKAIMFKCVAEETDMYGPKEIEDSKFGTNDFSIEGERHMRLRLVESYGPDRYPLSELKKHGIGSVQGPSRVSVELEEFLEAR